MTQYHLPNVQHVDVTPELICRILDDGHLHPGHEEGDIAFEVKTEDLANFMRATGHEVMIGYQQWGTAAQQQEQEGATQ